MNRLASAFRRGFSSARDDRLNEWTAIRSLGFWRYWSRRWLPMLIAIGAVNVAMGIHRDRALTPQLIDGLILIVLIVMIFFIVDLLVWRSTEKEWHEWKEQRSTEQVGAGNRAKPGA